MTNAMLFYDYGKMAYTANDDNVLKYPRNYRYRFIKRGDSVYKTNSFGQDLSLSKNSGDIEWSNINIPSTNTVINFNESDYYHCFNYGSFYKFGPFFKNVFSIFTPNILFSDLIQAYNNKHGLSSYFGPGERTFIKFPFNTMVGGRFNNMHASALFWDTDVDSDYENIDAAIRCIYMDPVTYDSIEIESELFKATIWLADIVGQGSNVEENGAKINLIIDSDCGVYINKIAFIPKKQGVYCSTFIDDMHPQFKDTYMKLNPSAKRTNYAVIIPDYLIKNAINLSIESEYNTNCIFIMYPTKYRHKVMNGYIDTEVSIGCYKGQGVNTYGYSRIVKLNAGDEYDMIFIRNDGEFKKHYQVLFRADGQYGEKFALENVFKIDDTDTACFIYK